jgi:hypothetical protein
MTIRPIVLLPAMLFTLGFAQLSAHAQSPDQLQPRLDHILLWGRNIDEATSILAVKLGFQIRPGHDPNGVANRYVRFSDRGFLELLGITRPNPEMDPGMIADQASLHGAAGSRSFGIYSSAPEQLRATLLEKNFPVTPIFTAPAAAPDEKASSKSASPDWRLFAFDRSPLSSGLFFIDYVPGYALQTSIADDRIVRTHPNGARALSAVWLLSSDANADRTQLARMGFEGGKPIYLPAISARGYCIPVGPTYILALEPDGPGVSSDALRKGGPQVIGISIAVTDIDRAQRWVERGYQRKLRQYNGTLGLSFLAPTQEDLGMFIEFHSATRAAGQYGSRDLKLDRSADRR